MRIFDECNYNSMLQGIHLICTKYAGRIFSKHLNFNKNKNVSPRYRIRTQFSAAVVKSHLLSHTDLETENLFESPARLLENFYL